MMMSSTDFISQNWSELYITWLLIFGKPETTAMSNWYMQVG